jgi:hypothetical protein
MVKHVELLVKKPRHWYRLVPAALLIAFCSTGVVADINAPEGVLIEAEDPPPPSTHTVIEDADASGGKAVTTDRDWEPVFATTQLAEGSVTIHVRHRNGPFIVKGEDANGRQQDLKPIYTNAPQWTWTNVGTFTREQIGERLLVIRTNRGQVAVDCVVLAPAAEAQVLPPYQPAADAAAIGATLQVHWDKTTHDITAAHWAVNDYGILRPSDRRNPGFNAYLADLSPRLIRIHWARFSEAWTDEAAGGWDVETIREAFEEVAPGYGDAELMINIPDWPRWFHDGGVLPEDKEQAFAEMCADLVRIMRDELGQPVRYWEVLNELEGRYERAERLDDLWRLLGRIITAMREVDPDAKFGAPALTWPKPSWVRSFMEALGDQVDFVTWHNYATDDPYQPNDRMFRAVDTIAGQAARTLEIIREAQPDRGIETFLSEYNVSWTWRARDRRMTNNIGAIFHAMIVTRMAELGVTGAMVWHIKDGVYGLLDDQGDRRPPAYLFAWGHRSLVGTASATDLTFASDDTSLPDPGLEVLAVRREDGGRSLFLINPADRPYELDLSGVFGSQVEVQVHVIDGLGVRDERRAVSEMWTIPGYSLTLLTTGATPGTAASDPLAGPTAHRAPACPAPQPGGQPANVR